jgi:hypothetical protein
VIDVPGRLVTVLITVSENGRISVDARGPVNGNEGLVTLLEEARKLAEQGQARIK